jgi:hypothetical protein
MKVLKMVRPLSLVFVLGVVLTASCVRDETSNPPRLPDSPIDESPILAKSSDVGLIDIAADALSSGLHLHLKNVPLESELECEINNEPLEPCHDGALYLLPAPGSYVISALAKRRGETVAVGASNRIEIKSLEVIEPAATPLQVRLNNEDFAAGQNLNRNSDYTFLFELETPPDSQLKDCDLKYLCNYDSRINPFWNDCSEGSFVIEAALMALDIQYLSIQATCDLEVGPIFTTHWFGVPDEYSELMVSQIVDGNSGRHYVSLVKQSDCQESSKLVFECAENGGEDFEKCDEGNVIENPTVGLKVRASCDEIKGPPLTLDSAD